MNAGLFFRTLHRESRGERRRLLFFAACLGIGVGAVVAVAGLAASLDGAIRSEARPLLAADLVISSSRPMTPQLLRAIDALPDIERAELREMPTLVAALGPEGPGRSRLVELKAVDGAYPFYGKLELEPAQPLTSLLAEDAVLVGPELLPMLEAKVGDTLKIGTGAFHIAGLVRSEPDRLGGAFNFAPRVMVSFAGLERAGLLARGSRVDYRLLLRLDDGNDRSRLAGVAATLKNLAGAGYRVETYTQAQPELRQGLSRVERFLGLVALLSLLAGGLGVGQTVSAWLAGRMEAIAVLKCLGLTPREILAIYVGQTALLGLLGSLFGVVLGVGILAVVPRFFADLIPTGAVSIVQPTAILRGLALGAGVALVFSLPPLARVLRVPPARVLRRDVDPPPPSRWARVLLAGSLAAGLVLLATAQSGSFRDGALFTAGLAVVAGLLALAAWALTRWARRFRDLADSRSITLTHGLAALARPGAATLSAIVALGLGVLVVLGMSLVESQLTERLRTQLPKKAPTVFLVDVQPDQWPGVQEILAANGATDVESVAIVTARIGAIDGTPADQLAAAAKENPERRWALRREQRMTYLAKLPEDNLVVEGSLWSDPAAAEVSVEKEFAAELGLQLGSKVTFDIQGVPVECVVTSIRTVDWQTFRFNFYFIVEPGVLEQAPQMRAAVAHLPDANVQALQDAIFARYPNVGLLNVRAILSRIAGILDRIGLGVRFVGAFTVLAGIGILAGAIAASSARRGREVALLKTLGMTRRGVVALFALEYALIGLTAAAIGTAGAGVLAWTVITRGMDLEWTSDPWRFAFALAGATALAVLAGLAASARPLAMRPIEVLRGES